LHLIPGIILSRIIVPIEYENLDLAAPALLREQIVHAAHGAHADLAIRGLR
jgi:hypothetical protein